MKIAILFSGHIRTYESVRENIFDNLIIPLEKQGHNCLIFSSIWSNNGFRENGWGGDFDKNLLKNDSCKFEIETNKRDEFINKYQNNNWQEYSNLSGPETCGDAVSMWYKIYKCFKLLNEEKNIDLIFRIRPDMYFNNKFDISFLKYIQDNTVYMPLWHGKYEKVTLRIMDHFSFGKYESMKIYCGLYDKIDEIIERNGVFTAEGFLSSHLKYNKVNIIRFNLNYSVMRTYGLEQVS
jgi:hypothetical protein|tara:strand:+ start:1461 stop:2171 length:711 start_codon:yes stop_codon:yes gene_type:complete